MTWHHCVVGMPSGTVTFLFTDIVGSTRLWDERPDEMRAALADHDRVVRDAVEANGGSIFATGGDGFAAAFHRAGDAIGAAQSLQAGLAGNALIRVRTGIHTGEVEERRGDYFGPAVNRAARIMAAGHGGQVLVSAATASIMGVAGLSDLGEHRFAGLTLPERLYQLGDRVFPALRALGVVASNLPVERSVFIGRAHERATVAGMVRASRAVTLTGVGGVGKTRLAVHTAAGLLEEFPGGVWLVELAPLIDAGLVPAAVASAVGAPPSPALDASEVVCRFLAQRRALVVLDNCEHVIDAAAQLVDRILERAPRVRLLATSREPLGVAGETLWRVPSLKVETDDGQTSDAVELFAARAAQVRPGFAVDATTRESVLAVCRRLDGIPLAIELAAARSGVMSVDQIAKRLDERFRLLTRGTRTAVARQQTLQGAIDWSYELLGAAERDMFDMLGVFAGGFDLAAAAAMAGVDEFDALELITQLVTKSMVEADPTHDRYRLLETLRQYSWDRLFSTSRLAYTRDAHAEWFSRITYECGKQMAMPGHSVFASLERLEADYDNLRAALMYLIEQQRAEDATRLVRWLGGLFNIRHPREGLVWFRRVLAIADDVAVRARIRLLADAGWAALNGGDALAAHNYAQQAIEIGGDNAPAVAHWLLGMRLLQAADYQQASEHWQRAIIVAAATGDLVTQVTASAQLVESYGALGDEIKARSLVDEVIERAERLNNPTITAAAYITLASAFVMIDAPQEAIAMIQRALPYTDAGGPIVTTDARTLYALALDDPHTAAALLHPAIIAAKEQLAGYHQLPPLLAAAKIVAQLGNPELAARLLGAYLHEQHPARPALGQLWRDRLKPQLNAALGSDAFNNAIGQGALLTIDQALQLAAEALSTTRIN